MLALAIYTFIIFGCGGTLGYYWAKKGFEQQAIKADAAEWYADPNTGECKFKFKTTVENK